MRLVPFLAFTIITIALIVVLSLQLGSVPPLGNFLSPQHGLWKNAEDVDKKWDDDISFSELKGRGEVFFDERLVPHVFADNEQDLFFIQGWLHAKFRLWQMEFQTYAAAGRISELLGAGADGRYLKYDRSMRRLGMVYAAERSLEEAEKNPISKMQYEAYAAGVNAYIDELKPSQLPIEYKLLNYKPEKWTPLKTALFLKYMSYDLTGSENDLENTNVRNILSRQDYETLYPVMQDSLDPIVPRGTAFKAPAIHPQVPHNADSTYFLWNNFNGIYPVSKPDKDNGSNNWAVSGSKTKSGRPILCNDPHLGLNLPSVWFEMQLHTPTHNVYGVTFPGAPCVVIGFNDSCSWGITNAERDVKDYYAINFKDESKKEYRYNGQWRRADLHIDTFKIKGKEPFYDTVAYTVFGPVQYDKSFTGSERSTAYSNLAVRWKAHDGSNELKTFYLFNRMKNYGDYKRAIRSFGCPGQNFVFASKSGDIAIWQQGKFPAKWRRQGDFIMPGTDTAYQWQGYIKQEENPHVDSSLAMTRGFVSSANQKPADTTYPYYLGGGYPLYRGIIINRYLREMNDITIDSMKKMQTDNYNVLAETALPLLLQNIDETALNSDEKKYLDIIRGWNFRDDPGEKGPVIFQLWFDNLEKEVWSDDLNAAAKPIVFPDDATLLKCLRDPGFKFIDNINTPGVETIQDVVTAAFKKSAPEIARADSETGLVWSKYKDTGLRHLLRQAALSRFHLTTGGGADAINATKQFHGPSWRMIVELTDKTEAWGIYPGGQSGNPGSKFYDNFTNDWAKGKYNLLWVMTEEEARANDKRVRFKMNFN